MSSSLGSRINRAYEKLQRAREREKAGSQPLVSGDVVGFCAETLGFKPTPYQERLLRDPAQFVIARWSRQTGKSLTITALILYEALANAGTRIAVLAPSLRQSKRIVRKVSILLPKLPSWFLAGKPLRTRLEFINGSVIEALPNNPETIRGETLDMVFVDEFGFIADDQELYDAIVYSLTTTDGRFIAASTPGSRDSVFFDMCFDRDRFGSVSRHHVAYRDALEPVGPLKVKAVEELRRQMTADPWRWQREMEAEFSEDESAFLPQSLIARCVGPELESIPEQRVLRPSWSLSGNFTIGLDLGKKNDHSVVTVVQRQGRLLHLIHLKQFSLGTPYASVIGYANLLHQKFRNVTRTCVDQTGLGEYIVEDMKRVGITGVEGVTLSLPAKQEVLGNLKKRMEDGELRIFYDQDLIAEMNVERFELTKSGQLQFSHPEGTHDDRLWALALGVWAGRGTIPETIQLGFGHA